MEESPEGCQSVTSTKWWILRAGGRADAAAACCDSTAREWSETNKDVGEYWVEAGVSFRRVDCHQARRETSACSCAVDSRTRQGVLDVLASAGAADSDCAVPRGASRVRPVESGKYGQVDDARQSGAAADASIDPYVKLAGPTIVTPVKQPAAEAPSGAPDPIMER